MMDANNGKPGTFLTTHWSLVLSAGTLDSENANAALESLCRSYWPPIHAYVQRAGHSSESARDLTQQFFARLLEKEWLQRADRNHGRFRNFLLTYLQRFLSDERDRDFALKRGGGRGTVSLEALIEEGGCFIEPMVT
jgi:RNA polymerase sigma-70 factor (ECF subfamily)